MHALHTIFPVVFQTFNHTSLKRCMHCIQSSLRWQSLPNNHTSLKRCMHCIQSSLSRWFQRCYLHAFLMSCMLGRHTIIPEAVDKYHWCTIWHKWLYPSHISLKRCMHSTQSSLRWRNLMRISLEWYALHTLPRDDDVRSSCLKEAMKFTFGSTYVKTVRSSCLSETMMSTIGSTNVETVRMPYLQEVMTPSFGSTNVETVRMPYFQEVMTPSFGSTNVETIRSSCQQMATMSTFHVSLRRWSLFIPPRDDERLFMPQRGDEVHIGSILWRPSAFHTSPKWWSTLSDSVLYSPGQDCAANQ